jgi:Na+/proline symporter/predicted transcriptional regulator
MVSVTVIYIAAMVILSWYVGKKTTNNETEFMIGGREFTPLMTAVGNSSILISGGYLPGIVMYGYMFGMGGMWFYLGWGTGALVALLCWAGFWRTSGAVTPTEWFEYRYGRGGRLSITVVILLASLAILGWQYVGSGAVIAGALGISPQLAILMVGIVVTLYVALGGIWAATVTDLIQFSWVALASFIILPLYLIFTYGWPDASQLPANFMSLPYGTLPVFKFVVPSVLTFLLMHQSLLNQAPYWARSAGTRNLRTVKIGWIWTVGIAYTTGVIGAFTGVYVKQLVPNLEAPSLALGSLLGLVPIPLAAIIMAGIMAATMSTSDIYLVSGVNQLVRDIAQYVLKIKDSAKLLNWAKWGTIGYGLTAVIFALVWQRGLGMLFAFGTGIGAPLFIFYLDSWLLKIGNGKGAIASVIASLGTVLYWELLTESYKQVHTLWIVFPVALITLVVVSLLTKDEEVKAIPAGENPSDLGIQVLTSLRRGYRDTANIVNILTGYSVQHEIQAARIHKELDILEKSGLVKREANRMIRQLFFDLTPEGEKVADKYMDAKDLALLKAQKIDNRSVEFMQALKDGPDSLFKMSGKMKVYMAELTAVAENLSDLNLIRIFGQGRIQVELTDQGKKLLSSVA